GRPAPAGIRGNALAIPAAEQPPHGHTQRLAEQVPEGDVDAADRGERDAPPADGREGPPLARGVVRARAVVAELPDRGDVAWIAADQRRRELLADQRDDGRVVAEVADGGLGLAESDEAGVRLDLDEAHVERIVPAEVAHVRAIGGDGGAKPRGANG